MFKRSHKFSSLHSWVDLGYFSPLAMQFALLFDSVNEKEATFLAQLWQFSKEGHVSFKLEEVEELLVDKKNRSLIARYIREGAKSLEKRYNFSVDQEDTAPKMPVCKWKDSYYLQKNWIFETQIVKHFKRLIETSPTKHFEESKWSLSNALQPLQKDAIKKAKDFSLSLILGGPGTGKTFTACHLLHTFSKALLSKNFRVAIAAPTGKAAYHLLEKIHQIGLHSDIKLEAKTLHSLLKIRAGITKKIQDFYLDFDMIIVDEASMIDIRLMGYLLGSVKPGSRLILIGDPSQLPPIESGNAFYDLAEAKDCVTRLEKSMRFEKETLDLFASSIEKGSPEKCFFHLNHGDQNVLSKTPISLQPASFFDSFEKHIQPFLASFATKKSPQEHLKDMEKFRILSVMRTGIFGVDSINDWIITKMRKHSYAALPILITSNDYVKQLYNGMHGILITNFKNPMDDCIFFPKENGDLRKEKRWNLPSFEYGFCLSVHKSQGSEFDHALLLIPEGSETFGKAVLYTAATRAKKKLEIVGDEKLLAKLIERSSRKNSGIAERINFSLS